MRPVSTFFNIQLSNSRDIVPVTIQVYYLRGKKANAEKIFRDKIFLDRLSDRGKYIILLGIATRQETAAG